VERLLILQDFDHRLAKKVWVLNPNNLTYERTHDQGGKKFAKSQRKGQGRKSPWHRQQYRFGLWAHELPAKLLDYFLQSNKSNINPSLKKRRTLPKSGYYLPPGKWPISLRKVVPSPRRKERDLGGGKRPLKTVATTVVPCTINKTVLFCENYWTVLFCEKNTHIYTHIHMCVYIYIYIYTQTH